MLTQSSDLNVDTPELAQTTTMVQGRISEERMTVSAIHTHVSVRS